MMGVEGKRKIEEMRDCLRRCDRFVSMFGDFSIVNLPSIISTVKRADKDINLKQLFSDIKRLAQ